MKCTGILTDLYELSMLQAYYFLEMEQEAVFSLFVRKLPEARNFLIACGLEDVLTFLENLHFSEDDLEYLESLGIFKKKFLDYLKGFRFTGDVYAMDEGTVFFENEPILEIKAPIGQAQLLETYIINEIHFQTLMASKAVRIVLAANGKKVVDFAFRRIHGVQSAHKAARAFYIAGVDATSNVYAGKTYNIPVTGTMAHSYVQAHEDEFEAFSSYVSFYPSTVLLVDTYDPFKGTENVVQLHKKLKESFQVSGIRIDSGDVADFSFKLRRILDEVGLKRVKIFASGGLDEYKIREIIKKNAPIDGFGIGTRMGVSADVPYLDMVYKLTEFKGKGRAKTSPGKMTFPYKKQVYRIEEQGIYKKDIICRYSEDSCGEPLLKKVMEKGKKILPDQSLNHIRDKLKKELSKLPKRLLEVSPATPPYTVEISSSFKNFMIKTKPQGKDHEF